MAILRSKLKNLIVAVLVVVGVYTVLSNILTPKTTVPKAVDLGEKPYNPQADYFSIVNGEPYSPVVIFSKSYCPFSLRAKKLLKEVYTLLPPPKIVELDQHPYGKELQSYILEKTGRRTVPNILVGGESRGGSDEMASLHTNGDLIKTFRQWSAGSLHIQVK